MIDPVVIDRGEIPRLALHQSSRDRVNRSIVTQDFGKGTKSLVFFLIDLGRVGNEGQDMCLGQFVRENLETRQLRPVLGRVDCSFGNAPAFLRIELHSTEGVRHDCAVDWLRWMTRPPANDATPQTALAENIPKRL